MLAQGGSGEGKGSGCLLGSSKIHFLSEKKPTVTNVRLVFSLVCFLYFDQFIMQKSPTGGGSPKNCPAPMYDSSHKEFLGKKIALLKSLALCPICS